MHKQFHRNHDQKAHYPYTIVLVFLVLSQIVSASSFRAQLSQWSVPEPIPGLNLESYPPILVPDQMRTIHAFSSQWVGGVRSIVYNQWSLEHGWSIPVDVLLSPYLEARVTDAYLDGTGTMHLVFYGGNSISGDIYYSQAEIEALDNPRAWSLPVLVGADAGDPESAVLVKDSQGSINILFHGKRDGNGLYITTSEDSGETWSDSTPIFVADNEAPFVWRIQAIRSQSGWLHVIWNVYDMGGQGRGVYYARSEYGNAQWSNAVMLAETTEGLGSQTPAIVEYDNTLYALYNIPAKINVRHSVDNGLTWSDPTIPFARHTGVNGSLSLVIDGNNMMHLFFGQRIPGSPDIHGMWHSLLVNNRWTEPSAVVKGPRVIDQEGLSGFDPYDARAVVSQGNVILVTWRTDPGDIRDNGVWYSYAVINAPELPIATYPPSVKESITPSPEVIATPVLTPTRQIPPFDRNRQAPNPIGWLMTGVVVAGLLGIFYRLSKRNR